MMTIGQLIECLESLPNGTKVDVKSVTTDKSIKVEASLEYISKDDTKEERISIQVASEMLSMMETDKPLGE